MSEPLSIYPIIPDWTAYTEDRAPGVLRQDNAWAMTEATTRLLGDLDNQQAELIRQMDPNLATGALLDACGDRVGEPRGGLADGEYRQIILARTASTYARGTRPGVLRTWLALTGANIDRVRMMRWGPDSEPVLYMWAQYDFAPSVPFLRRGGTVLLDAVTYPFDIMAFLVPAGGFAFDSLPGFDSGPTPYQFLTVRA